MATAAALAGLQIAERTAQLLASRFQEVEAVGVFGSVARGDATSASDLDLLIVTDTDALVARDLRAALPPDLSGRVSLMSYPLDELERLFMQGASFATHLRLESRILLDRHGRLGRLLRVPIQSGQLPDDELRVELSRLEALEDIRQFGDNFLFCFSMLYAIGKSVVMLVLAREETPEFNRDRAFETFRRLHPDLAQATKRIEELKPFYLAVTRRERPQLPFPYRGTGDRVAPAIAAIRALGTTE
jgi:uncharacterized protein